MLFIIAMDPLQRLLDQATQAGLLHPLGASPVCMRTNLYADDAALFVRPIATHVEHLQQLLESFGQATGLCTNFHKSEVLPIRCDSLDMAATLGNFQAKVAELPCRYLGLPLRLGRLTKEDEQLLIDKVAEKLPNWKGRLLNKAGRLALVNSVLSSTVLYHMSVFKLSKWAL
jgi:hypothetical protein